MVHIRPDLPRLFFVRKPENREVVGESVHPHVYAVGGVAGHRDAPFDAIGGAGYAEWGGLGVWGVEWRDLGGPNVLETTANEGDAILLPEIGAHGAGLLHQPLQQGLFEGGEAKHAGGVTFVQGDCGCDCAGEGVVAYL